jgi:hypothetical protein
MTLKWGICDKCRGHISRGFQRRTGREVDSVGQGQIVFETGLSSATHRKLLLAVRATQELGIGVTVACLAATLTFSSC